MGGALVTHVASRPGHSFSKTLQTEIRLIAGHGVEGDGHAGATVQHRSRVAKDPSQPNLRQVHLMAGEFHDELNAAGFDVSPGDLGENLTTRGIALLELSAGSRLRIGHEAVVEITGLRNPCWQLDAFQPGLTAASLGRDAEGGRRRDDLHGRLPARAHPVAEGDEQPRCRGRSPPAPRWWPRRHRRRRRRTRRRRASGSAGARRSRRRPRRR